MNKYICFVRNFIVSACCILSSVVVSGENVIGFNDGWRFILDDNIAFGSPDFDDSEWRELALPHDWSIEGHYDKSNPSGPQGGYMPCGTGWYRKSFVLPDSLAGKRIFINFDGVFMKSSVWINGRMVGEYPNGYNAFQYDITPFVKYGANNVVAVRVDNSLQPASRWYTGSGIYRDVKLVVTDQLHFTHDGVFVHTSHASPDSAVVDVSAHVICNAYPETVFNWSDNTDLYVWTRDSESKTPPGANRRIAKDCVVEFVIMAPDGSEAGRMSVERRIGDFTENDFEARITVPSPQLWSADTPDLYTFMCRLLCEGNEVDRHTEKIGLRSVSFSPETGMTENGKPEKLRGVCLHQNVGPFGVAVPKDIWRDRLLTLKDMGCNAVRLSHYPFASYMYDLCDSIGLYVTNEIFDEWNRGQEWGFSESSYGKMPYTYHLYFEQWAETDLTRMIRRDRNHPSVILYVLGNEIPNQRIKGNEIARKLVEIAHREDFTRPVTAACDFFAGANIYGFMDNFDIAGYNYIDRIHRDSLYAQEHQEYPGRILLGTETYHSAGNPIWSRRTDSCIGEFVWVGFDYLGEIVWDGDRGWSESMNDIAGFPKPEHYLRKSYWSNEPVVHIGVEFPSPHPDFPWSPRMVENHWNWPTDTVINLIAYSNCDEVELRINGKKIARKAVDSDSCLVRFPSIKFTEGKAEAIAYRDGRKCGIHVLATSGPVSRLEAAVSRGDFYDCVEVRAVDRNGVTVPSCNATASVTPSGCSVAGIDNGNQYDPEGRKYTSKSEGDFYKGRMRLYVRRGETPGLITVAIADVTPLDIDIN